MPKLRIFVGSWNVNAKSGAGQDLRKWLCKSGTAPDIVAVSLQEIVQLSDVTTYVQNKRSEEASESWARQFVDCLESHGPYNGAKYSVIAVSQLIGVMTCVLARREHRPKISRLMIGYFAVGRFGVLGNKGAVAIRFRLQTASHKFKTLCFIGSHLSAHQKEVAKRNADFANIFSGLRFAPLDLKNSKEFLSKSIVPVETLLGLKRSSQVGSTRSLLSSEDQASSFVDSALGLARYATATFTDVDVFGTDAAGEPADRPRSLTRRRGTSGHKGDAPEPEDQDDQEDAGAASDGFAEEDGEELPDMEFEEGSANGASSSSSFGLSREASPSSTSRYARLRAKAQNTKAGRSLGRIGTSLTRRAGSLRPATAKALMGPGVALGSGTEEDFSSQADLLAYSYGRIGDEPITIRDHDMIFWFGDLNYRIDSFSWRETIDLIRQKNLHRLMEHDQLTSERAHERVFQDFHEGLINFVPTYKFQPGTNHYDTRGFKDNGKKVPRTPSWCDRILWRLNDTIASNRIQQCSYYSCAEYLISDHKPVGAEFVLPFVELSAPPLSRSAFSAAAASLVSPESWVRKAPAHFRPVEEVEVEEEAPSTVEEVFEDEAFAPAPHLEEDNDDNDVEYEDGVDKTVDHEPRRDAEDDEDIIYGEEEESLERDWYSDDGELRSRDQHFGSGAVRTVIAVRDFNAREAEEISFRTGDLLELFMEEKIRIDDGWLLGRRLLDGSIGYFPASSVNALGAVTKSRRASVGHTLKALRKATALRYDRKKAERDARLRAVEDAERDYERDLNRRQRLLNTVRKALVGTSRKMYERRTWSMDFLGTSLYVEMVATEDYVAADTDELSFAAGDVAFVVSICPQEDDEDGWYMARIGDLEGLVPRRCFEPVI